MTTRWLTLFFACMFLWNSFPLVVKAEDPAAPRPYIVGHRGLITHAPENTLATFRACLALRLGFEVDVRRSADGELVCVHDDTVNRTTGRSGRVAGLTRAELRQLDAGAAFDPAFRGERIPTLREVCQLIAETQHNLLIAVDVKTEDVEDDAVQLANEHGVLDRLLFIGLTISSAKVREKLRKADPSTHTALLVEQPAHFKAAIAAPDADWLYVRFLPGRSAVEQVHRAGKRLFIAGPLVVGQERTHWREAADQQIDAILTDYPLELRQLLREPRK